MGDLHHVTSNGLDAIYPEELADFVDSDQFSTLNWKLYPSVDAMDLGQWETQYSSQARSDHLQPKWITEWQLPDHVDPTWDDLPDVPDEFPMPEAYIYQRKVLEPLLLPSPAHRGHWHRIQSKMNHFASVVKNFCPGRIRIQSIAGTSLFSCYNRY